MIPFFLPCWQSTVIRDVILGFLLAAALLYAFDERAPARAANEPAIQDGAPAQDRGRRPSRDNVVEIESGLFVRQ